MSRRGAEKPRQTAMWQDAWRRLSARGVYPHQLAFFLLLPFRRVLLSPRRLVGHLDLAPDFRVLELGCGPGFFSVDVARAVPRGRLELVDIQPEMLEKAKRRLRRAAIRNAGFANVDGAVLPFAPGTFDVVFAVAVLGEVHAPGACLASIARVLRPGGLLSVAELPGDPDRLSLENVSSMAVKAGLELDRTSPLRSGFIARFRRPP